MGFISKKNKTGSEKSPLGVNYDEDLQSVDYIMDDSNEAVLDDEIDDIKWWPEFKSLGIMASQVSLATIARMALTNIDTAFLGHLDTPETKGANLAAATLAQTWTSVPLLGVWAGASSLITLCGQAWGAKNYSLTGIWLQFGLIITFLLGIPVFVWYWVIEYPLSFSTPDANVAQLGALFGKALSFSIFPSLAYACLRQYFQAMGIMWPTTVVGLVSIAVTILANQVLIHGIGSWHGFGFVGSPLATVVAAWVQPFLLIMICVVWKKYHKKAWPGWKKDALTGARLKSFCKMALPVAGNSLITNISATIVTLIAARLGNDIISANAVITGLWTMLWALFWGFGCSTQVRVAHYIGAGKPKAAKKLAILGLICTIAVVFVLSVVCLSASRQLFSIYTSEPKILAECESVVWLFVLGFALESCEMLITAVLTGMGKVRPVFIISMLATWCINLPLCYVLGLRYNWGLMALWFSVCCMEAFKIVCFSVLLVFTSFEKEAARAYAEMKNKDDDEIHEDVDVDDDLKGNNNNNNETTRLLSVKEDLERGGQCYSQAHPPSYEELTSPLLIHRKNNGSNGSGSPVDEEEYNNQDLAVAMCYSPSVNSVYSVGSFRGNG